MKFFNYQHCICLDINEEKLLFDEHSRLSWRRIDGILFGNLFQPDDQHLYAFISYYIDDSVILIPIDIGTAALYHEHAISVDDYCYYYDINFE